MNKKFNSKSNIHGRLLLVFLVLLMSALIILPSGCLDSDEAEQVDPGAQSVTPDSDPKVPSKPADDNDDDTPVKVKDDDKPEDASTSQSVARSFSSGGSSGSSSSSPPSPDVSKNYDSGDHTVDLGTITGDLTITGATDGTITLPADLTVNGDLTVNTPNATVNNYANVGGTITINAVSVNTWNQYGNASSIQMGAKNATLNFFAGDVPQGIKLTKPSRLVINASSGLPNVTVTGDAQDSDIDNLGGGELNLTADANVTVAGNVNVTGVGIPTERTARGSLALNPTSAVYTTNFPMVITYTAGEDLVDGEVNITVPEGFTVDRDADYLSIAGETATKVNVTDNASYTAKKLTITNLTMDQNQKIVLTLNTQQISATGTYDFNATASNDTKLISNAATASFTSTLNNDATLSDLKVDGTTVTGFAASTTAYEVNVTHDVGSVDVNATLFDASASLLINGTEATNNVDASVSLNASGESTSIDVVVTAEDGETTETYTVTVNRAAPDSAWVVNVTAIGMQMSPIDATINLYSDSGFENPASLTESLAKDSTTVYASMINQFGTTYYTVVLNRTVDSGWDVIVETDNISNPFASIIVTAFNDTTVSLYSDTDLESSTGLDSILTNETGYIKVTAKDDSVTSYKVEIEKHQL